MLIEALLSVTAETTPALRRLGLVRDAVALWSRATRRARDWAPHEARSRSVVERAVATLPRHRIAVVLGSGLGRDVPLDVLAQRFERVILVDAVHLWPVRWRARRLGFERQVIDLARWTTPDGADGLAVLKREGQVDLVVSACLLSQLPHAPARRDEEAVDLATSLVRRHLEDLAEFGCRVCLVTDVNYAVQRPDGSVEERFDLLGGVGLPPPDESWDWVVAPTGEIERWRAYVHRVHAYPDLAAAIRRERDDARSGVA